LVSSTASFARMTIGILVADADGLEVAVCH
jgi:hypothetical protein